MFPSMMIYRLRVLQGDRIGEGTILKKQYLSRLASASWACRTAFIPCLPPNNTTPTPNSLDVEQQTNNETQLEHPPQYVATLFTAHTAIAFYQSIYPCAQWQFPHTCGNGSMPPTVVHCQTSSQPDADFIV